MLDRRNVLWMGGALLAFTRVARAAEKAVQTPSTAGEPSEAQQALAKAIGHCIEAGDMCLAHCLVVLGAGETELAECARSVRDMLAICAATQTLVASNSPYLKSAVQLCVTSCTDCERACRKHAEHHAVCKACADACAATINAARPLLA